MEIVLSINRILGDVFFKDILSYYFQSKKKKIINN